MACVAAAYNDQELQVVTDMIMFDFFFLLRPGEYTGTKYDRSPFRLSDATFSVVRTVFDTANATDNQLNAGVFVIRVFTTHKNGVRGEKIGDKATGDPLLCPNEALRRRVVHIQKHGDPVDTSLAHFKTPRGR